MRKTYILAAATILAAVIGFAALRWNTQPNEYIFSAVVKDPGGHPFPNARIQATFDQSIPQDTTSDADGAFHLQIPSSVRSLHLSVDAGDGYQVLERDANPHRTGPEILYLRPKPTPAQLQDQSQRPTNSSSADSSPPDSNEPTSPLGRAMIKFFSVRVPGAKSNTSGPCVPNSAHPYQCLDAASLGQKLLVEAAQVRSLTSQFSNVTPTMVERQKFTDDVQKCCWKDMLDLRYAVFDRLGPAAQSREEERAWEDLALYQKSPMKTLAPDQVFSYTRYFEDWGNTLEQKPGQR